MNTLITFQEFEAAGDKAKFISDAISRHKTSRAYLTAKAADRYFAQRNETIINTRKVFDQLNKSTKAGGTECVCSNFFYRLNTQRTMYSLGKGVAFSDSEETKEKLGPRFDEDVKKMGKYALIHGVSFPFWNLDHIDLFKLTEFAPFWDEVSGVLKAGVRWWQVSPYHRVNAVLYEEDGYTTYRSTGTDADNFVQTAEKQSYKTTYAEVAADGLVVCVEAENYSKLPIFALWGTESHLSTLEGLRGHIDSYDLVKNGFVDDVRDCAEIYWLLENYGGMNEKDEQEFLDRLNRNKIASVDTMEGGKVQAYTQEVPTAARETMLARIKSDMYEDFGALDVHTVAAGATNDHIDAAYQPLDEQADEFESSVRECIKDILALQGIEDTPVFTRNRISNQKEQVEVVAMEAQWLDEETILRKLPNITPDEVAAILERNQANADDRLAFVQQETEPTEDE